MRKTAKNVASIQNTEDKEWIINPTISTESDACSGFFIGKPTLVVPPKQTVQYEIVYNPKTMTKKNDQNEPHKGSLFFPLPNGTALLYRLTGNATEPEPEGVLQETVQSKKAKFIIIPVKNWLKSTQRFKVSWLTEGGGELDQTTQIRGANTIDVAGESQKDYKLSFLTYKNGVYKINVTFKNESTGEYLFFKINVTSTDADLIERIELVSPIRESISKVITIENPTDNEVTITRQQFAINNEYIEIVPDTLKIPAKTEKGFEVIYRPLIVSAEQEVDLVLKNPVLGDYKYKLLLKGIAPSTQRSMAFKCALGTD